MNITNSQNPDTSHSSFYHLWLPSVLVAFAMVLFLTFSFCRHHRRVMKKRIGLLDYALLNLDIKRPRISSSLCNTYSMPLDYLKRSLRMDCPDLNTGPGYKARRLSEQKLSMTNNREQTSDFSFDFTNNAFEADCDSDPVTDSTPKATKAVDKKRHFKTVGLVSNIFSFLKSAKNQLSVIREHHADGECQNEKALSKTRSADDYCLQNGVKHKMIVSPKGVFHLSLDHQPPPLQRERFIRDIFDEKLHSNSSYMRTLNVIPSLNVTAPSKPDANSIDNWNTKCKSNQMCCNTTKTNCIRESGDIYSHTFNTTLSHASNIAYDSSCNPNQIGKVSQTFVASEIHSLESSDAFESSCTQNSNQIRDLSHNFDTSDVHDSGLGSESNEMTSYKTLESTEGHLNAYKAKPATTPDLNESEHRSEQFIVDGRKTQSQGLMILDEHKTESQGLRIWDAIRCNTFGNNRYTGGTTTRNEVGMCCPEEIPNSKVDAVCSKNILSLNNTENRPAPVNMSNHIQEGHLSKTACNVDYFNEASHTQSAKTTCTDYEHNNLSYRCDSRPLTYTFESGNMSIVSRSDTSRCNRGILHHDIYPYVSSWKRLSRRHVCINSGIGAKTCRCELCRPKIITNTTLNPGIVGPTSRRNTSKGKQSPYINRGTNFRHSKALWSHWVNPNRRRNLVRMKVCGSSHSNASGVESSELNANREIIVPVISRTINKGEGYSENGYGSPDWGDDDLAGKTETG